MLLSVTVHVTPITSVGGVNRKATNALKGYVGWTSEREGWGTKRARVKLDKVHSSGVAYVMKYRHIAPAVVCVGGTLL